MSWWHRECFVVLAGPQYSSEWIQSAAGITYCLSWGWISCCRSGFYQASVIVLREGCTCSLKEIGDTHSQTNVVKKVKLCPSEEWNQCQVRARCGSFCIHHTTSRFRQYENSHLARLYHVEGEEPLFATNDTAVQFLPPNTTTTVHSVVSAMHSSYIFLLEQRRS